jgi:hypothetical protein
MRALVPTLLLAVLLCCGDDSASPGANNATNDAGLGSDALTNPDAPDMRDAPIVVPPTEGAGTRFFPRHLEEAYSDGSVLRNFVGFYDRNLSLDCAISEVLPNQFRCVPQADRGSSLFASRFKDAACTQSVYVRSTPIFARNNYVSVGRPCDVQLSKLGPTLPITTTYVLSGASCTAEVLSDVEVFDAPTAVPLSEFGEFVRSEDPRMSPFETPGTRIRMRGFRFTASDGAFSSIEPDLIDSARGSMQVLPLLAADSKMRLLPKPLGAVRETFADGTCTTAAVGFPRSAACSPDPTRAEEGLGREQVMGCAVHRVYAKPSGIPLAASYVKSSGVCQGSFDGAPVYAASALTEAAAGTMSEATIGTAIAPNGTTGSSLEPVRTLWSASDGLRLLRRETFFVDKTTKVRCQDIAQGGEPTRCLPEGPSAVVGYRDAACTDEILVALSEPCSSTTPALILRFFETDRFSFLRRPTSTPTRITALYAKSGATCRSVGLFGLTVADAYPASEIVRIPTSTFPERVRSALVPAP